MLAVAEVLNSFSDWPSLIWVCAGVSLWGRESNLEDAGWVSIAGVSYSRICFWMCQFKKHEIILYRLKFYVFLNLDAVVTGASLFGKRIATWVVMSMHYRTLKMEHIASVSRGLLHSLFLLSVRISTLPSINDHTVVHDSKSLGPWP